MSQTITAVEDGDGVVKVTYSDASTLTVAKDHAEPEYRRVRAWVSAGGVISPEPPAQVRRRVRDRMLELHGRVLSLEREKAQNPGAAAALQTLIDQAQAQIDALRPQS